MVEGKLYPETDDKIHPKWKLIIQDDHNHPKLDFIRDEIIIHFGMIMYGNFIHFWIRSIPPYMYVTSRLSLI